MFGLFKSRPQIMTPQRAERITNAFGKLMMDKPTTVGDERDLPYSKAEIKEAIRVWLRIEPRAQVVDQLRAAYVSLADYLPLTAAQKAIVARYDASARQMPDLTNDAALAAYLKGFEVYQALTQKVADEAAILLAEINSVPVWDGNTIPNHIKPR